MPTTLPPELTRKARAIRLLALDVDGVLTDGRLWFGNSGEELKAFDIQDGLGVKLLQRGGVEVAIITGRRSELVARRARELGIERLVQGREDKLAALTELCIDAGIAPEQVAYMGDDLPDLGAIRAAGLGLAPANANAFVATHADHRTQRGGGAGAVREACELILRAQGKLDAQLESYL
jgi:3-deoxy-D-manno-octulosonate 8-phosphate phosphatase (KDO 8-P phosphatase)